MSSDLLLYVILRERSDRRISVEDAVRFFAEFILRRFIDEGLRMTWEKSSGATELEDLEYV
jgi:hypothetical protein